MAKKKPMPKKSREGDKGPATPAPSPGLTALPDRGGPQGAYKPDGSYNDVIKQGQGVVDTTKGAVNETVATAEKGLNQVQAAGESLWDTVSENPMGALGSVAKAVLPSGLAPLVDAGVKIANGANVGQVATGVAGDYIQQALGEKQLEVLRSAAADPQGTLINEATKAAQPLMQQAQQQMAGAQAKVQETAARVQQGVQGAADAATKPMTEAQQQVQSVMPNMDTQGASTVQQANAQVGKKKRGMFR